MSPDTLINGALDLGRGAVTLARFTRLKVDFGCYTWHGASLAVSSMERVFDILSTSYSPDGNVC